jgi:hypothetical protein
MGLLFPGVTVTFAIACVPQMCAIVSRRNNAPQLIHH